MNTCETCKHWNESFRGEFYAYGKCSEIREKLSIEITSGWDGAIVDYLETDNDFGCILHVKKEDDSK